MVYFWLRMPQSMKGEVSFRSAPNNQKEVSLLNISFFYSVLGRTFFNKK